MIAEGSPRGLGWRWWLSHHLLWHNGDEALRFEYRTTNSTTDFRCDVEHIARRGWEQYNHVERAAIQISASAVCTALCLWKCSEQLEASGLKYYLCPSIAFMHILFTFNVNTLFKCRLFQATKEEEELSAEERRKLERKLKKERKKKEKQLMREAGMAVKKVVPKKQSAPELALAYLTR